MDRGFSALWQLLYRDDELCGEWTHFQHLSITLFYEWVSLQWKCLWNDHHCRSKKQLYNFA